MELLTIAEVAAILKQHRRTVERKIEAGRLRAVRLGSHAGAPLRVEASELRRYVHGEPRPAPPQLTDGQRRAFYAMVGNLERRDDEARGTWKRRALVWASARFGRTIESTNELESGEASDVLDWLAKEQDLAEAISRTRMRSADAARRAEGKVA